MVFGALNWFPSLFTSSYDLWFMWDMWPAVPVTVWCKVIQLDFYVNCWVMGDLNLPDVNIFNLVSSKINCSLCSIVVRTWRFSLQTGLFLRSMMSVCIMSCWAYLLSGVWFKDSPMFWWAIVLKQYHFYYIYKHTHGLWNDIYT